MATARIRYLRHRSLERLRHSTRLLAWLDAQATRLTTTVAAVFNALHFLKPAEIEALSNIDIPVNTVSPAITGTAQVNETLTVSNGTWTAAPTATYSYQWNRAGVAIPDATASTYVVVEDDIGSTLTCTVTATNVSGTASKTSAETAAVIA